MATPTLVITATLNTAPVSRQSELQVLQYLSVMAREAARSTGGNKATSGTVNGASGVGSATWAFTPNAAA